MSRLGVEKPYTKENLKPIHIELVQEHSEEGLFEQRESKRAHTPYEWEQLLFSCIRDGNSERLEQVIKRFSVTPLMIGRLSSNDLRQAQYLAVAFMTLATRAAIQGGMLEMDAYNKSDFFIQQVDKYVDPSMIMEYMIKALKNLTIEMHELQIRRGKSQPIRVCLEYIYENLHSRISLEQLAKRACLSIPYLCSLFKREVGVPISKYIVQQKIEAAKSMLLQTAYSAKDISNYLDFSSQSYFIHCFRRECGLTPYQFRKKTHFLP